MTRASKRITSSDSAQRKSGELMPVVPIIMSKTVVPRTGAHTIHTTSYIVRTITARRLTVARIDFLLNLRRETFHDDSQHVHRSVGCAPLMAVVVVANGSLARGERRVSMHLYIHGYSARSRVATMNAKRRSNAVRFFLAFSLAFFLSSFPGRAIGTFLLCWVSGGRARKTCRYT